MRPTFEKTVDILVKAYLNDTLEHDNCHACAVGNLVAAAKNWTYEKDENGSYGWRECYTANWFNFGHQIRVKNSTQAEATGYTIYQLNAIERAFEGVDELATDRMFLGLMAVVDVLAEIHGIDLKQREEAKLLFVK